MAGEPSFLPFLAANAAKNGLKILFPSLWDRASHPVEEGLGVGFSHFAKQIPNPLYN